MAVPDVQLLSSLASLEVQGREAAFSLLTINHLSLSKEGSTAEIVNHLFCIVGIIPALRNLLVVTPDSPLFGREQVEILFKYIALCHLVLSKINVAVNEANEWIGPFSTPMSPESPTSFYPPGEMSDDQMSLRTMFVDVVVMISAARAEYLSRFGFLSDDDVFEGLRLRVSLEHPDFTTQPGLSLSPSVPPATRSTLVVRPTPINTTSIGADSPFPSNTTLRKDVIELQHPRGFRGRYGHPDYPLPNKQAHVQLSPPDHTVHFETSFEEAELRRQQLREEGKYPDITAFGVWPPTSIEPNSVQDHQLRSMMSPSKCKEASNVVNTPGSAGEDAFAAVDKVAVENDMKSGTATCAISGPASEAKPHGVEKILPYWGSNEKPVENRVLHPNPVGASSGVSSKSSLEAYILRPVWEDTHHHIEWSYAIDQLPIGDTELQVHMRKLGSDYSVIDAIAELLPEQLRLIQIRVKARQGHLVSVQYGRAADMVMKMGNFQMKSVIFILRMCLSPTADTEPEHKAMIQPSNIFSAYSAACNTAAGSASRAGQPTITSSSGSWPPPRTVVDEYLKRLSDQGEACLYMEKEPHDAFGAQHFQSIFFSTPYQGLSFEELRLDDLKAGRTGPLKASSNVFATDVSTSTLGGGGLFGRPTTYQGLVDHSSKPFGGLFGAVQPAAPGRLFRGATTHSSTTSPFGNATQNTGLSGAAGTQARPGYSLFKGLGAQSPWSSSPGFLEGVRTTSTTGATFDTSNRQSEPQPSRSGLFGGAVEPTSNPPPTGLFGMPQTTTTNSLFATLGTPNPNTSSTSLFNTIQPAPAFSLFAAPSLFSTIHPAPARGLFDGLGSLNINSPLPAQSHRATSSIFASGPPTSTPPTYPSLFASTTTPPSTHPTNPVLNSQPRNPSTSLFSTAYTQPQPSTTHMNDSSSKSPTPFTDATATFHPVFNSTTATTTSTSISNSTLAPPRAETVTSAQPETQTATSTSAQPETETKTATPARAQSQAETATFALAQAPPRAESSAQAPAETETETATATSATLTPPPPPAWTETALSPVPVQDHTSQGMQNDEEGAGSGGEGVGVGEAEAEHVSAEHVSLPEEGDDGDEDEDKGGDEDEGEGKIS